MFLLNHSIAGIAMSTRDADGRKLPASSMKGILLTAGLAGAVGAAYLAFRKKDESLDEVPGVVEEAAEEATKDDIKASKDVNSKLNKSPVEEMPTVKPAEEPKGFWGSVKEAFTPEKPPEVTPPPSAAKPPEAAAGAPQVPSVSPAPGSVAKGASIGSVTSSSGLAVLTRSYRSKFVFSGFKNSEGISRDGSYTAEEAQTIVALKNSKAQTSGFSKVPDAIEAKITTYANRHGVDPDLAKKMARIESGGNPNAISSTGAIGVYQFTGSTATGQGITNRFNEDQNIEAGILLMKANIKGLPKDIPATAVNLYLYHQLGAGGAPELIRAAKDGKKVSELSAGLQKQLGVNIGSKSATAAEYVEANRVALEGKPVNIAKAAAKPSKAATVPSQDAVPTATTVKATEEPKKQEPQQTTVASNGAGQNPAANMPQSVVKAKNGIIIGT